MINPIPCSQEVAEINALNSYQEKHGHQSYPVWLVFQWQGIVWNESGCAWKLLLLAIFFCLFKLFLVINVVQRCFFRPMKNLHFFIFSFLRIVAVSVIFDKQSVNLKPLILLHYYNLLWILTL